MHRRTNPQFLNSHLYGQ